MRTDGVHCQESVGTGPVVLKVVPAHGFIPVRDKCFLLLLYVCVSPHQLQYSGGCDRHHEL